MENKNTGAGGAGTSIIVEKQGAVSIITINRPEKLNVLNAATLKELRSALQGVASDAGCKIVIITGAGDKAFCAGADISYFVELNDQKSVAGFVDNIEGAFNMIEDMEKPVIAAIHGYCLGGGCELALACDIRIAAPDSKFSQPEVHVGIIPGAGGTYRLPVVVGAAKAKEMIFTGDMVGAEEALRIGLVSKVVAGGALMQEAMGIAGRICGNSLNAVKEAKRAINAKTKRGYDAEKSGFLKCFEHPDAKEGISAFLEHRKPKFA